MHDERVRFDAEAVGDVGRRGGDANDEPLRRHSILNRAVVRAMARDKVKRNVVGLCTVPVGQAGRPSKSLTLEQAGALLAVADDSPMRAYIVLSLLSGARTEEVRALRWCDIDLIGHPTATPPVPPSVAVPALGPPDRRHQDAPFPPAPGYLCTGR